MQDEYWNHNTAFHRELVAAASGRRVLDVGCGDGLLLARMRGVAVSLNGVDPDSAAIERARDRVGTAAELLEGTLDDRRLRPGAFGLVTAVAVLHHLPLEHGLARLAELAAPGGEVRVIGLSRAEGVADHLVGAATVPVARVAGRVLHERDPDVRTLDAAETLLEIRAAAQRVLPGARIRRRLWYRYSLVWVRPEVHLAR